MDSKITVKRLFSCAMFNCAKLFYVYIFNKDNMFYRGFLQNIDVDSFYFDKNIEAFYFEQETGDNITYVYVDVENG